MLKKLKEEYCNILGIIDLATKNLVLRAVKTRDVLSTAQTWLYDVIAHKDFQLLIHSDHAREFISTAMESLLRYSWLCPDNQPLKHTILRGTLP